MNLSADHTCIHTTIHIRSCLSSAFILHLGRPSTANFSLFPTQHSNSSQASMRSSCAVVAFCVLSDMDWHWAAKAAISRWMLAKSWSAFSTCAWKKETGIETHRNGYLLVEVQIYCRCFCWFCVIKKMILKLNSLGNAWIVIPKHWTWCTALHEKSLRTCLKS